MGEEVVTVADVAPGDDGAAPESAVVRDMFRRALWAAPALILLFGLIWGIAGALSTAYGIALVLVNFALAAALMTWAGRISLAAMGVAAMFGFLVRLGLIFVAVLVVRGAWWVSLVPLGITIIVTHLGLLLWEMKYVSASLAFPGLKPSAGRISVPTATLPKESTVQ